MIRIVKCFECNKRHIIGSFYWKYDKYMGTYPKGTACRKCSKKRRLRKKEVID